MDSIIVCDFCLEEVRTVGDDAIYVCEDHGVVEAYWHELVLESD